jgi:hypothetical protein
MANEDGSPMVQEQQPDAVHDGAPAGPFFTDAELPSVAVLGGAPMTLGGYSPDPSRTPQGDSMDPPTLPPVGLRR